MNWVWIDLAAIPQLIYQYIANRGGLPYRAFSGDVTAAILVFQNEGMAAILVYQTSLPRVELYFYAKIIFRVNQYGGLSRKWKRSISLVVS